MAAVTHGMVTEMRAELAALADPERAPQMQRYMKSAMPFRGVAASVARPVYRAVSKRWPLTDRAEWELVIRSLYNDAGFREERYAALSVLGERRYAQWLDRDALRLLRELIVAGAWWDLVDEASSSVGVALRADPDGVQPTLLGWAHDDDMWLRRTAIIAQRTSRDGTDLELLTAAIQANESHRDFFIRKAIGWALREYSKTGSDWVRAFVASHPNLSPLSRREALRWLDARPTQNPAPPPTASAMQSFHGR